MHGDGLEPIGVARHHQGRHAGAGRQACNGDPIAICRALQTDLVDGAKDQRRFFQGPAVAGVEPVPAALRVRQTVLLGIQHHETLTRCHRVHACAVCKAFCVLVAAVQHDQQRQLLGRISAWRAKECVAACARSGHGHAVGPSGLFRRLSGVCKLCGLCGLGLSRPRLGGSRPFLRRDGLQRLPHTFAGSLHAAACQCGHAALKDAGPAGDAKSFCHADHSAGQPVYPVLDKASAAQHGFLQHALQRNGHHQQPSVSKARAGQRQPNRQIERTAPTRHVDARRVRQRPQAVEDIVAGAVARE